MIDDVEVRNAGSKGRGVYARRAFGEGEFIFLRRHTRILTASELPGAAEWERIHLCELGFDRFAVLAPPGCYLNHSCDPNAMRHGVKVFAWRSIEKGEEITIDYRLNAFDGSAWPCECGAGNCTPSWAASSQWTPNAKRCSFPMRLTSSGVNSKAVDGTERLPPIAGSALGSPRRSAGSTESIVKTGVVSPMGGPVQVLEQPLEGAAVLTAVPPGPRRSGPTPPPIARPDHPGGVGIAQIGASHVGFEVTRSERSTTGRVGRSAR